VNRPAERRQMMGKREHGLVVRGKDIEVRCICGDLVPTRETDRTEISLDDLLALVRVRHHNA
jgi:hypothetical protein